MEWVRGQLCRWQRWQSRGGREGYLVEAGLDCIVACALVVVEVDEVLHIDLESLPAGAAGGLCAARVV